MLSLLATSYHVTLKNSKYQLTIPRSDKMTKLKTIQVKNSNLLARLRKSTKLFEDKLPFGKRSSNLESPPFCMKFDQKTGQTCYQ